MDIQAIAQSVQTQCPGAVAETAQDWIIVNKAGLLDAVRCLKTGPLAFNSLHCISAVDRNDAVEVVYHLYSFEEKVMLTLKVILKEPDLEVESLTSVWEAANWLEREVFDLFGIRFLHHPDLRRILNPDEWTDYPMRKNFKRDGFIPRPVK